MSLGKRKVCLAGMSGAGGMTAPPPAGILSVYLSPFDCVWEAPAFLPLAVLRVQFSLRLGEDVKPLSYLKHRYPQLVRIFDLVCFRNVLKSSKLNRQGSKVRTL